MRVEYKRLAAAVADAEDIVSKLRVLKTEYHPQEVRSLVRQFEWTVLFIMRMCNDILDSNQEDFYGPEVDNRIKAEKILYKYETIWLKIGKGKSYE
jgi:hypothetical protein